MPILTNQVWIGYQQRNFVYEVVEDNRSHSYIQEKHGLRIQGFHVASCNDCAFITCNLAYQPIMINLQLMENSINDFKRICYLRLLIMATDISFGYVHVVCLMQQSFKNKYRTCKSFPSCTHAYFINDVVEGGVI